MRLAVASQRSLGCTSTGRLDFVFELEHLCDEIGADFVEVVLLSNPQEAADRFVRRSLQTDTGVHRDAQALLERRGGIGELPAMYDRLLEVVATRPGTISDRRRRSGAGLPRPARPCRPRVRPIRPFLGG